MSALVDSHAHLQGPEFAGEIDSVMLRAAAAGVRRIVVPGVDLESSRAAVALARQYDAVCAAAGFHPHEASRFDRAAAGALEALIDQGPVNAVGEIGLDYFRMHSPREAQVVAFQAQLDLARRRRLPVVVHCRDAWADMTGVLLAWAREAAAVFGDTPPGVMHYFSAGVETAERFVDAGFLISVHTSVTHPRAEQLREVAAALPLECLLVETDSPYGAPQSRRGRRNEPAYVVEAAARIAVLRGIPIEAVAEATTANARRLFGLPAIAAEGAVTA